MDFSIVVLLLAAIVGISAAASADTTSTGVDINKRLREYFNKGSFNLCRHPILGAQARRDMLSFINEELVVIQARAGLKGFNATIEHIPFKTTIKHEGERVPVEATNLIFTLYGTVNKSDDEPLMLLSNYDTDDNINFINEGSGVAAMLVIAEHLIQELASKGHKITHSIVFAFTDLAYKKYSFNHAAESTTGATEIAKSWLPQFLAHRKSFRGAIVLDNIMNYNETAKSQIVTDLGFDKSFSESYRKMADSKFAANFLGLVHRDDHLDNPLVKLIQDGWKDSKPENSVNPNDTTAINPLLLPFAFENEIFVSTSVNHFLASEQSAFWNHHVERDIKQYPAVTLTDTRIFRECRFRCTIEDMTTRPKLAFMKRTILTLTAVLVESQTDSNGALPLTQASNILLLCSIVMAATTRKLF